MSSAVRAQPSAYEVVHETEYRYQWPADSAWQLAHLQPRETASQQLLSHRLLIDPAPEEVSVGTDYFGNPLRRFSVPGAHGRLLVRAESRVRVQSPRMQQQDEPWVSVLRQVRQAAPALRCELAQFCLASPHVPLLADAIALARSECVEGAGMNALLLALARRVQADFRFDPDATHVGTPLVEVMTRRRGVCQDFAHVMIAGLRGLGFAARYVSGYLLTEPPPGQARLVGADASHAWVSVWCGQAGWVDVDPTNGRLVDASFVTLGWGRDYGDVPPLRGVVRGGGQQELSVRVTVSPMPG